MPLYFFNIVQIDGAYIEDTIGIDLHDLESVQDEAARLMTEMSEDAAYDELSELRIDVRDSQGNQVALEVVKF